MVIGDVYMLETITPAPDDTISASLPKRIAENGYRIVPILPPAPLDLRPHIVKAQGKAPGWLNGTDGLLLREWQALCDADTPETAIKSWGDLHADGRCGFGLAGGIITGIDLDIMDAALADRAEAIVASIAGPTIARFGRAPKRTLIYRAAAIAKSGACSWHLSGVKHGLDVIAHGKQTVAFGIHPGTMKPYTWRDNRDPSNTRLADLPAITQDQVDQIVASIHALMVEAGHVEPVKVEPVRRDRTLSNVVTPPHTITTSAELLRYIVEALPNDYGYDQRIKIGMAIHTEGGDFALFDTWSKKYSGYNADSIKLRWANFGKTNKRANTFGTLMHHFRERVGDLPPHLLKIYQQGISARARVGDLIETAIAPVDYLDEDDRLAELAVEWAEDEAAERIGARYVSPVIPPRLQTPSIPRVHIDALRKTVHERVKAHFTFEARRRGNLKQDKHLHFKSDRIVPRFVMGEAMGSGKSTSFARVIHENKAILDAGENILAIVQSGDRANDLEENLEGLKVRNVRAAPNRCDEPLRLPKVQQLYDAGLPVDMACNGCPLKKDSTCRYWSQFTPAAGEVIIAQLAHLKIGHLKALTEDGAGPLFMTFIDESPLSAMTNISEISRAALLKPLVVAMPKIADEDRKLVDVYDDETKAWVPTCRAADIEATNAKINVELRQVLDMLVSLIDGNKPIWTVLRPDEKRKDAKRAAISSRVPLAALKAAGFWKRHMSMAGYGKQLFPNMCLDLMDWAPMNSVHAARKHFHGKMLESAGKRMASGASISGKGQAAAAVKMLDSVISIMTVIGMNEDMPGDLSTITIKQPTGKAIGVGRVTISAGSVAEIPAIVKKSAIMFADATVSLPLLGMLMREDTAAWTISRGDAHRPFSTTYKVHGAPVAAAQLGPARTKEALDASEVVSGGSKFSWGRPVATKADIVDMRKLPRHANARMIERYVQWIMAHRPGRKIGIIGPMKLIGRENGTGGFRRRPWAKDVVFGHHNAVVGSNAFENVHVLFVIGQNRPPVEAVEEIAMAYALEAKQAVITTGEYPKVDVALEGRVGREAAALGIARSVKEVAHVDPLVNEVLHQLSSQQQVQAYERARMTNRMDPAEHVEVFAIDQLATSMQWDGVLQFHDASELAIFEARHGRKPSGPVEAVKMAPDLFVNRKQAQWVLSHLMPPLVTIVSPQGPSVSGVSGRQESPNMTQAEGALTYKGLLAAPDTVGQKTMASPHPESAFASISMQTALATFKATGTVRTFAQALRDLGYPVRDAAAQRWLKANAPKQEPKQ
jgi:hypothetical protein